MTKATKQPSNVPRHRSFPRRRGAVVVLAAFLLVAVLIVVACAVDIGYVANVKTELQSASDAAALAGAGALADGDEDAAGTARRFAVFNGGVQGRIKEENVQVDVGEWDSATKNFLPSSGSAVRVTVRRENEPFFFARILGRTSFDSQATSIAMSDNAPREVMVVLDVSQTMNDDSELKSIGVLGRTAVEASLWNIYRDLGSPKYGTMDWTPDWVTIVGNRPTSASQPQITVTFKSDSVYITSSKDLSNVVLGFGKGAQQKFDGLKGLTGTFRGTGANANQRIEKVWVKSGSNKSGGGPGYGELFQDNIPTVRRALGLQGVPYPFASGSWDDYISYAQTSPTVQSAGYRDKYGHLTWINYLLEQKPAANQTADLWRTSSEPLATAKSAASIVLARLEEAGGRVGLTTFNSSQGVGQLESPLARDYWEVDTLIRQRQAGHYALPANLGSGIERARDELVAAARPGAAKTIVLISDGRTDRPTNASAARAHALAQAQLAAAAGVRIIAVSVGAQADAELMRQLATRTNGTFLAVGALSDFERQVEDLLRTTGPSSSPRLVH